jgi:DNA replication protein DnaC
MESIKIEKNMPLIFKENNEIVSIKKFIELFEIEFNKNNKRIFLKTDESNKHLYTLLYYFFKNEKFNKSPLIVHDFNKPNLDKGLLIIGDPGVGKTSTLKTIQSLFYNYCHWNKKFHFKFKSVYELVSEFEALETPTQKGDFFANYTNGFLCIDDVKAESLASNFGKEDIIKKIIYLRDENKSRTLLTCNFDQKFPNNVEMALEEFNYKYDNRTCDRILGMCNIVQLSGNSFRY